MVIFLPWNIIIKLQIGDIHKPLIEAFIIHMLGKKKKKLIDDWSTNKLFYLRNAKL